MRILRHLALALLAALPTAAALSGGCGGDTKAPSTTAGGSGGGGTSTNSSAGGADAGSGGHAGGTGGTGGKPGCATLGSACALGGDCCTGVCAGGVCNLPACTSDGEACAADAACCSGVCAAGSCAPLNTTCKTLNNACAADAECCSGLCSGGKCQVSSFCGQVGDICDQGTDCCGGICNLAGDAGLGHGTCGPPPSGSANCTLTDGMLCAGVGVTDDAGTPTCGGACCSRLCAPYGPTGVLVCQPASGCHVVGDLCTKDGDCCGSAGLPGGSGNPVTCDITPPALVGVCRNPQGCKPDGNVCKLSTMSCNASCDCCSGNCNTKDTCKLDSVGVPRCAAEACVGPGEACATSANCCNNLPCVPNPADGGTPPFICYQSGCVPACGPCAIDADCCVGSSCVVPIGSTKGTCGPCGPVLDGGAPDSGLPDSGLPDSGPICALYGQQCTTSADCCNDIPCNSANGPCNGQTGCTCHQILQ